MTHASSFPGRGRSGDALSAQLSCVNARARKPAFNKRLFPANCMTPDPVIELKNRKPDKDLHIF
jgi:hypothetical protein